jgi:perosamine synthetase
VESAFERQGQDELPIPVFTELGYNYKLSDIQSAVALVQLDRLPALLERRRSVAAVYAHHLDGVPGITLPVIAEGRDHTWQAYVVTLEPSIDRGRVVQALRSADIQANMGTYASHLQPVYHDPAPCPVSADLFRRHLAIPMHANMTESDAERVAGELQSVLEREMGARVR